jgi:hypothetical protein
VSQVFNDNLWNTFWDPLLQIFFFVDVSSQLYNTMLGENPSMLVEQKAGWANEEEALLSVPAIETRAPVIGFMTE